MKTLTRNFLNSKIQPPLLCTRLLKPSVQTGSLGSHLDLSSSLQESSKLQQVEKKKSLQFPKLYHVLVSRVVAFLALKKALVKSSILNGRLYLAFLIFCFSPWAFCIHMSYSKDVKYEWMGFIENWFHLFNMLGPYLFALMISIGYCLMISPQQKTMKIFKWDLSVTLTRIGFIPIGITMAKLTWLCFTTSNEDFWSIPNYSYFLVGGFAGYIFYRVVEYLTWRKFHAFDGIVASIEGLYKLDLEEDVRREKVLPLIKELRAFHSKY